jgi:streptomycin 6-kinase
LRPIIAIPKRLELFCQSDPARLRWLKDLPEVVEELGARWSVTLGRPFDSRETSCSWVAPAVRSDGEHFVLKIGAPHMEAEHEVDALRFLEGDPTVFLIDADISSNAMLLEYCNPGTSLREHRIEEQDSVIAGLMRRFWRAPPCPHRFRHLSAMIDLWCEETRRDRSRWPNPSLVGDGIEVLQQLAHSCPAQVLLATDLHAGNVLRAEREPWLVIDPKPFVGDPAFDATQHLLNTRTRVETDPHGTISQFAAMLGVDPGRVRMWMFGRAAAEPRAIWDDETLILAAQLRA